MSRGIAACAEGREIDDIMMFSDDAETGHHVEDDDSQGSFGQRDARSIGFEKHGKVGDGQDATADLIAEVHPLDANISDATFIEDGLKVLQRSSGLRGIKKNHYELEVLGIKREVGGENGGKLHRNFC